ncbi:MAG TPA: alpha/beta fold hydrolase [Motilibacteraceae bacterium]|nr:alpha/beta fold hydrolase [Motilibacteraceae bacterium]
MRQRRLLLALAGVLAVLLVVVVVVGLHRQHREPGSRPVAELPPGPVVLVPGYGGSRTGLEQLAARLQVAGRQTLVLTLPGGGTGDLRDQARALDAAVRGQLDAGAPSVDVVGYSAGGVVARLWAADLGGAKVARRVVTLGSPHHGTQLAGLAAAFVPGECPLACQQLASGSPLLDGLPDTPAGPRWTSIWTRDDQVVRPPDSARLTGAVDVVVQDVCADATTAHGTLPTDPLVTGLVLTALDGPPLTAVPPASQCSSLRALGTG